jgi:hypothetical protein
MALRVRTITEILERKYPHCETCRERQAQAPSGTASAFRGSTRIPGNITSALIARTFGCANGTIPPVGGSGAFVVGTS